MIRRPKKDKKSILIVDDSELIRLQIRKIFKDQFSGVHLAINGSDAIYKAKAVKPNIVTMDLTMPEMDGIECIPELVKIDPKVKILVISALSDNTTCLEALKRGAHGFLDKPFTEQELSDAIQLLLED